MKKLIFLSLASLLVFTGCYKDNPAPALSGGECEFIGKGYDKQALAQAELNRVVGILNNYSIGNADLKVIREQTYVAEEKKVMGKPTFYKYQVVFSCADAALKHEYARFNVNAESYRDASLRDRLAVLNADTNGIKVLDSATGSDDTDDCESRYNPDTNQSFWVCTQEPYYTINFIKVINSELQKQLITSYDLYKGTATTLGFKSPKLDDMLGVAMKVLPSNTDTYKVASDLKNLLDLIETK